MSTISAVNVSESTNDLPIKIGQEVIYRPTGERCIVVAYAALIEVPVIIQKSKTIYVYKGREVSGPYVLKSSKTGEIVGGAFDDIEKLPSKHEPI